MSQPHKHRDVIIAWANGEEIEVKTHDGRWLPLIKTNPDWEATDYRIKPKIVKREGWVNVYPSKRYTAYVGYVFETQEAADRNEDDGRAVCIRIEWEEEV